MLGECMGRKEDPIGLAGEVLTMAVIHEPLGYDEVVDPREVRWHPLDPARVPLPPEITKCAVLPTARPNQATAVSRDRVRAIRCAVAKSLAECIDVLGLLLGMRLLVLRLVWSRCRWHEASIAEQRGTDHPYRLVVGLPALRRQNVTRTDVTSRTVFAAYGNS